MKRVLIIVFTLLTFGSIASNDSLMVSVPDSNSNAVAQLDSGLVLVRVEGKDANTESNKMTIVLGKNGVGSICGLSWTKCYVSTFNITKSENIIKIHAGSIFEGEQTLTKNGRYYTTVFGGNTLYFRKMDVAVKPAKLEEIEK